MTKPEYEHLATFRYALRQFLHFSEKAARAVGLTPQQHQALLAVRGFPGRDVVTVSELADRLQISHNSAVELVDRLHANGLCRRTQHEGDRRQVYIELTTNAEQTLEALSEAHWAEMAQLAPRLAALLTEFTAANAP